MSVEQAKAFIEKMKTDEGFRFMVGSNEGPKERMKFVRKVAKFDFTAEEFNEAGGDEGGVGGDGWYVNLGLD